MESVKLNFPTGSKLGFVSTIQFVPTLQEAKLQLEQNGFEIALSQNQPLSPGEVLGCTAPVIENVDGIIYLGKIHGDFSIHLERHFRRWKVSFGGCNDCESKTEGISL